MERYEKYKESGIQLIGEIPEHWEVTRIRQVANIFGRIGYRGYKTTDLVPKGEGAITISPSNMKEYHMDFSECTYLSWEKYEESPEIMISEGDILFVKTGSTYGKTSFVDFLPEKATINPQIVVLKDILCDNKYLWYSLKSVFSSYQIETTVVGGTIPTISQDKIRNYSFLSPTPVEQTAIANYLDCKTAEIEELIADKKRLLELYQEEKTAIINQAVTKGVNPDVPMKDSRIEWLGEIPENWDYSPLKYLGKFINGFSFKSTDFKQSGARVLKISNIQNMRIDWSDESFIDEEYYDTYSNFRVLKDDLVFALTRPIISSGIKVAMMDLEEKILLNQRNSIYRPTEINVKWIYYLLLSAKFIQEFDSRIDKTGQQPNISSNDIAEISIPVPPQTEQEAIIEFIDNSCETLNQKIKRVNQLIDLLTEYRTALISEVVTGKIKVTE